MVQADRIKSELGQFFFLPASRYKGVETSQGTTSFTLGLTRFGLRKGSIPTNWRPITTQKKHEVILRILYHSAEKKILLIQIH